MAVKRPHPTSSRPNVDLAHLVAKLDSLASFYQQQLDWVDETRAQGKMVEVESDDDAPPSETGAHTPKPVPTKPPTAAALRRMHWRRQMRSLESKLNGKKIHKHRPKSSRRTVTANAASLGHRGEEERSHYILSMFEQMMGARIQSCRRIQKLVAITSRFDGKIGAGRSPDQT